MKVRVCRYIYIIRITLPIFSQKNPNLFSVGTYNNFTNHLTNYYSNCLTGKFTNHLINDASPKIKYNHHLHHTSLPPLYQLVHCPPHLPRLQIHPKQLYQQHPQVLIIIILDTNYFINC